MISREQMSTLIDQDVFDPAGEKVGTVGQAFYDAQTGEPSWVSVRTGLFGMKESFAPLGDARLDKDGVWITASKDTVKDAPRVDVEQGHLGPEEETELYRYYGIQVGQASAGNRSAMQTDAYQGSSGETSASDYSPAAGYAGYKDYSSPAEEESALRERARGVAQEPAMGTADAPVVGTATPSAAQPYASEAKNKRRGDRSGLAEQQEERVPEFMRYEERVRVGTEQAERGRVRLVKHVVEEDYETSVPVRREEVRIHREPIEAKDFTSDGQPHDFADDETEFVLYEERPIVTTESVPVERIRLEKEMVTEQQTIHQKLRKEQVDIAGGEMGLGGK